MNLLLINAFNIQIVNKRSNGVPKYSIIEYESK